MITTARKHVKAVRTSHVPQNESKQDRFRRLALRRIPKALRALESIRKLSSSNYEYTPEQAEKIITTLGETMLSLQQAYSGKAKATFEI